MQATLDWATIRSPIDGTVIDKKVDVGDTVTPGQMLVTLYDPKRMQLVATVRESLAHRLKVGQEHRRARSKGSKMIAAARSARSCPRPRPRAGRSR